MNKCFQIVSLLLVFCMMSVLLCGCGRRSSEKQRYEVVNGQVVDNFMNAGDDVIFTGSDSEKVTAADAGSMDISTVNEGVAFSAGAGSSPERETQTGALIEKLKLQLSAACDAVKDIYMAADKGSSLNVTISADTVASMLSAVGGAGYSVTDSIGDFNMQACEAMHDFGQRISLSQDNISGTYFIVYPDGHLSGFMLSRESGIWHLYSASAAWNDDGSYRIYSEGRYAVGEVRYTDKGWLIYSRDTSDYSEDRKVQADNWVMVRVLPYDAEKRDLCRRYVEPVGYLENNLFVTDWDERNMGPIDFNSLYAYVFALYNGTDMLSSYNVRKYYKAVQGTKLYLVPADIFENNTTVYFNIDRAALKNISDYNASLDGYFFVGYNRDYYNVPPKTPSPEVVSCTYNSDGTITMVVDAVNTWYGTDRAFRHELTVRPSDGPGFRYVSNHLIPDENNIIPKQKLCDILDVELTKTTLNG